MSSSEQLFRVTALDAPLDKSDFTMKIGSWSLHDDGTFDLSSLSVLIDSALGSKNHGSRAPDTWTVTSELSAEFFCPPHADADRLTVSPRALSTDARGGTAACDVKDDKGTFVASAVLRSRFVQAVEGTISEPDSTFLKREQTDTTEPMPRTMLDTIGGVCDADAAGVILLTVPGNLTLANSLGTLHGGIVACASQHAGARAIGAGSRRSIGSLQVKYLRPVSSDSDVVFRTDVLHDGRGMGVAQVTSRNGANKLCSIAVITTYA